jgi:hypothetical protein
VLLREYNRLAENADLIGGKSPFSRFFAEPSFCSHFAADFHIQLRKRWFSCRIFNKCLTAI